MMDKVPEVYVSESRDFQTFVTLLSIVQNSILQDVDNIPKILDTINCPGPYVRYLSSKLGLFLGDNIEISEFGLKVLLTAFPDIMRHKGSKLGVTKCVNAFSRAYNLKLAPQIEFDETNYGIVYINFDSGDVDFTNSELLKSLMMYVLPAGYEFIVVDYPLIQAE
jgi:hypothetical protein